ncbi:MAG: alpha/beta hydrolase fold domain-containing protein [Sphingobium sp.]
MAGTGDADDEGRVLMDALALPPSTYMSQQARRTFARAMADTPVLDTRSVQSFRRAMDEHLFAPAIATARSAFPVTVTEERIADVPVRRVSPAQGARPDRILIGLHGGGFRMGGGASSIADAIPMAAATGLAVVSIDYRLAPEHVFPAARDDVLAVYRALLADYPANAIGLYGIDAGGTLAAMSVATLIRDGLPRPAALGIFSAAATFERDGDSMHLGPATTGHGAGRQPNPLITSGKALTMIDEATGLPPRPFVTEEDQRDPVVTPDLFPDILAHFPPTLLMVGGRAPPLSAATMTKRRMTAAGAEADLMVWDGLWHTFLYDVDLPEAREAYAAAARFFARHFGRAAR